MRYIEAAIDYVRENIDLDDVADIRRLIESQGMELVDVSEELNDEIHDLMEEFGDNFDLPESWWEEEMTTEDILFKL